MSVAHPIALLGWALLAIAAAAFGTWRLRRRTAAPDALRLANPSRLAESRTYRRRRAAYRALVGAVLAATLAAFGGAAALSARPIERDSADPRLRARDVMLCLDVSSSMEKPDQQVLREYEQLVRGFNGERIGLTIFNSAPVSVFPLTNDYDYVVGQLRGVAKSFTYRTQGGLPPIYSGTVFGKTGSSLVGDGLASCLARLHATGDERRSSSVVLASDNTVGGTPLITLPQAASLAKRDDVRVYGLDGSPRAGTSDPAAVEFRDAVRFTGGEYFSLADEESVGRIIDSVRERQAEAVPAAARVVERDTPGAAWMLLAGGVLGLLVAAWVVRL